MQWVVVWNIVHFQNGLLSTLNQSFCLGVRRDRTNVDIHRCVRPLKTETQLLIWRCITASGRVLVILCNIGDLAWDRPRRGDPWTRQHNIGTGGCGHTPVPNTTHWSRGALAELRISHSRQCSCYSWNCLRGDCCSLPVMKRSMGTVRSCSSRTSVGGG